MIRSQRLRLPMYNTAITNRASGWISSSLSSSARPLSRELRHFRTQHYKSDNNSNSDHTNNNNIIVPTMFQETASVQGTVEGVWIFCRHGDRAPSRCLSPPQLADEEAAYWVTKLPYPDSMGALEALSQSYPPDIHPSNNDGQFLDVERKPFGFLTELGILQSQETGRRFFHRYNELGHHLPGHSKYLNAKDFLNVWNVKVYSTNYLRTVMSVQGFLDGMLGTHCYTPRDPTLQDAPPAEFRIPDHRFLQQRPLQQQEAQLQLQQQALQSNVVLDNTVAATAAAAATTTTTTTTTTTSGRIQVQVRDRAVDTLNAFDRNPDLMADLVAQVVSQPSFQCRDGDAAPLAARLANILPGLARKGRKVFGGPSNINWIEAMDHFVCRRAHNVSFARFSNFEHDDRVDHMLAALSYQTLAHLAWRYRQWFQSPRLLAAIAAPPLREIHRQLVTTPSLGIHQRRPFVVYSCHDVTILSLLYGIGAEFLADEEHGDWRFWPPYSSTLVFELVRTKPSDGNDSNVAGDSADNNNNNNNNSTHVVRVLLNGVEIQLCDLLSSQNNNNVGSDGIIMPVGNGPNGMLLLDDFDTIVTKLERKGGFLTVVDADTSNAKRDMSTWTG